MKLIYPEESYIIRGIAFNIYKKFRNGYKEKVYHNSFFLALLNEGLAAEKEKQINVFFDNKKVGVYVPDLIVEEKIIIELKAKPKITIEDTKQFWHYLKSSDYKLGFLINFGAEGGVEIIRKVYETARINKKFPHCSA